MRLKNRQMFILLCFILIAIDQAIKLIIWSNFMESTNYSIIGGLLYFHPSRNTEMSRILMLVYTVVIIFSVAMLCNLYRFYLKKMSFNSLLLEVCLMFAISSAIATLIDSTLWGGSFGYVHLVNRFVFGMKDFYAYIFLICLIAFELFSKRTGKTFALRDFARFTFKKA